MTKIKIESTIEELVSKDAIKLIKQLIKRDNISEFVLAKNSRLDIKKTRNLLYRLYEFGLVSFNRKKDKKK